MKALAILCLLVVAGCAGTPATRSSNSLAIACDGYAVALATVTPYKSLMSAEQIAAVDASNAEVDPLCLPGSLADPALAAQVVQANIAVINLVKGSL